MFECLSQSYMLIRFRLAHFMLWLVNRDSYVSTLLSQAMELKVHCAEIREELQNDNEKSRFVFLCS